jgi:hemerythrin
MSISWNEDLATGLKTIDDQHKEIFKRINVLLDACAEGKGRGTVGDVLDFLAEYIVEHFADEESIQQLYGYPDYVVHKAQHDNFMYDLMAIIKKFKHEGASLTVVHQTNRLAVDWLIRHIKGEDKVLADFVKEHPKSPPHRRAGQLSG